MTALARPFRARVTLIALACVGLTVVLPLGSERARAGATTTTTFTTAGEHSYTIPSKAAALQVVVVGAAGANGSNGAAGGLGESASAVIPVPKNTSVVYAEVGAPGTSPPAAGGSSGSASIGGGGGGGGSGTGGTGGGGGGSSDIRTCSVTLCSSTGQPDTRLIVAAGGGGGGGGGSGTAGGAGGTAGADGTHGQAYSSQPGGGGGYSGGLGGTGANNPCDEGYPGYDGGQAGSIDAFGQPGDTDPNLIGAPGGQAFGGGGGGGFADQTGGGGGGGGGGYTGGGGGGGGGPCNYGGGSGGGGGGGGLGYAEPSATDASFETTSNPAEVSITPILKSAPSITSASSTTFTVDKRGKFTVTASGYPPPKFSLQGQPSWLSIGASSGVISGKPPVGSGGVRKFTVTASNGVSPKATQTFKLKVDQAPAITSPSSAKWVAGKAQRFQVKATGYPAPRFLGSDLPGWLKLGSSGALTGTPPASAVGATVISIEAKNVVGATTQAFTLNVVPAPPWAMIVSPSSGRTFSLHQKVVTSFSCKEGLGGPGLESCDDSNGTNTVSGGNGHLNTSRVGRHVYTVTARSKDGRASEATITYEVAR